jgi:hypothetical protein
VIATLAPALVVWPLAIAPGAVDTLASEGNTLHAFKNGFIQALVLGPLIGLSQATALRDDTTRWKWWFVGALSFAFGKWLVDLLAWPREFTPAFPVLTCGSPHPPRPHRRTRPEPLALRSGGAR